MSAIATPAARAEEVLDRAAGIELLGEVHGSGYRTGSSLVRRPDGQVVQLGPLMYALLEAVDGRRTVSQLADDLCERLGRPCDEQVIAGLAQKLAGQGLLAGHEHNAPPRRNPLLALRWKFLITNPRWTRRLTAPFTFLFRPWIVWPVVACFLAVCWLALVREGFAAATSEAFRRPELLVLVFVLTIASAAFHEIGHAAACRYGGAEPGGMGAGIYLVWPAFYTDVTDAYRLPRADRLRVDLGGIYFNALVAVVTAGVWLAWRVDALFLLIGLQLLMMVKNLSPVIRSDGYHILADATGVPDLYAHIKPTLLRLLPWRRREPSALHGRARLLVTVWVLVVVPVLLALMLGAVILLPRLLATAWDSGHVLAAQLPHQSAFGVIESLLRLVALTLPAVGSLLVAFRLVRMAVRRAAGWSAGRPLRRVAVVAAAAGIAAGAAWAWWPSGQYRPVVPSDRGTIGTMVSAAAPAPAPAPVVLTPGKHLAVAMVPVGGPTKKHPALYFLRGAKGQPPVALINSGGKLSSAFPFQLPAAPGPGGTEARAVNTTDGGVVYDVEYALITVSNGAPVTNTNAAYALASCSACTTVAVSFQVVLVVGHSDRIAPINAAVALNYQCPACMTTAIADQLVITLSSQPTQQVMTKLEAALRQLGAISALGAGATPAQIAAEVGQVEQQVNAVLQQSGLESRTSTTATTSSTTPASTSPTETTSTTTPAPATAGSTTTVPAATTPQTTTTDETTTTDTTTTTPTTTSTTTTTTTTSG
jgi:putative peptide zinc metalloprotease protein